MTRTWWNHQRCLPDLRSALAVGLHASCAIQKASGATYVAFGDTLMNVGRSAGNRLDNPKTHELMARGYDGLNPGVRDPAARLEEQAVDGIMGEVMYPSINMAVCLPERDVVQAVFQRHNDWILDSQPCPRAPGRHCLSAIARR